MVLILSISVSSGAGEKEKDKKCEIESTLVKEAELSGQGRKSGAKGKKAADPKTGNLGLCQFPTKNRATLIYKLIASFNKVFKM